MARSRLLLIDDSESSRRTFSEILTRAGYEVVTASSGEEGVAFLREDMTRIDLILTDLRMPGACGFEVLAAARACLADVPVVIYSSFATGESEIAARQLGVAEFVSGPVWAETLVGVAERHLRVTPTLADERGLESASRGPAAQRWAALLMPVVHAPDDVPTVERWGTLVGRSPATLRARCACVGVRADDSLDFARSLRVTRQHEGLAVTQETWFRYFDVLDHRTLERLLGRGGLPAQGRIPSAHAFLLHQQFVSRLELIAAIRTLLHLPS